MDRFAEQLQEQADIAERVRQKDDLVSQLQQVRSLSPCSAMSTCHLMALSPDPHSPWAQALSDSHSLLYEERARLLKLQQANDEHRLRVLEHERRIRSLQAHCRAPGCRHPDCGGSKASDGLHPEPESPHSAPGKALPCCQDNTLMTSEEVVL